MTTPRVSWKDKALFTPGPLTTSPAVKAAMLRDLGARDAEFLDIVLDVKKRLLNLADVDKDEYAARRCAQNAEENGCRHDKR